MTKRLHVDRLVLSLSTSMDTAMRERAWTEPIARETARLKSAIPWAEFLKRAAAPPSFTETSEKVFAPDRRDGFVYAVVPAEGRIAFCVSGVVGHARQNNLWQVVTHAFLLDRETFRAVRGNPYVFLSGPAAQHVLDELTADGAYQGGPGVVEPLVLESGSALGDAAERGRRGEVRRLAAHLRGVWGEERLARALGAVFESLAVAAPPRTVVHATGDGTAELLVRLAWLALPERDRTDARGGAPLPSFSTDGALPASLASAATDAWRRPWPAGLRVLTAENETEWPRPSDGRRRWAELVASGSVEDEKEWECWSDGSWGRGYRSWSRLFGILAHDELAPRIVLGNALGEGATGAAEERALRLARALLQPPDRPTPLVAPEVAGVFCGRLLAGAARGGGGLGADADALVESVPERVRAPFAAGVTRSLAHAGAVAIAARLSCAYAAARPWRVLATWRQHDTRLVDALVAAPNGLRTLLAAAATRAESADAPENDSLRALVGYAAQHVGTEFVLGWLRGELALRPTGRRADWLLALLEQQAASADPTEATLQQLLALFRVTGAPGVRDRLSQPALLARVLTTPHAATLNVLREIRPAAHAVARAVEAALAAGEPTTLASNAVVEYLSAEPDAHLLLQQWPDAPLSTPLQFGLLCHAGWLAGVTEGRGAETAYARAAALLRQHAHRGDRSTAATELPPDAVVGAAADVLHVIGSSSLVPKTIPELLAAVIVYLDLHRCVDDLDRHVPLVPLVARLLQPHQLDVIADRVAADRDRAGAAVESSRVLLRALAGAYQEKRASVPERLLRPLLDVCPPWSEDRLWHDVVDMLDGRVLLRTLPHLGASALAAPRDARLPLAADAIVARYARERITGLRDAHDAVLESVVKVLYCEPQAAEAVAAVGGRGARSMRILIDLLDAAPVELMPALRSAFQTVMSPELLDADCERRLRAVAPGPLSDLHDSIEDARALSRARAREPERPRAGPGLMQRLTPPAMRALLFGDAPSADQFRPPPPRR